MTTMSSKKRALPMTPKLLTCLLLTALAGASGVAHAERADRDKPMNIEADALRHDELKQTSVFTGNVVMTKGSIVLRGAQLDVRQDGEGYQHGVVKAQKDLGKCAYGFGEGKLGKTLVDKRLCDGRFAATLAAGQSNNHFMLQEKPAPKGGR